MPPTILVLEDSILISMEVEMHLRDAGFQCLLVTRMDDFEAQLDARRLDVIAILADCWLIGGAWETWRETLTALSLPVALMVEVNSKWRQVAGDDGFALLTKPLIREELLQWLDVVRQAKE